MHQNRKIEAYPCSIVFIFISATIIVIADIVKISIQGLHLEAAATATCGRTGIGLIYCVAVDGLLVLSV